MFKYLIREACAVFILVIENMTVKVTSKDFSCGVVMKGSSLTLVKKTFTGCDSFHIVQSICLIILQRRISLIIKMTYNKRELSLASRHALLHNNALVPTN